MFLKISSLSCIHRIQFLHSHTCRFREYERRLAPLLLCHPSLSRVLAGYLTLKTSIAHYFTAFGVLETATRMHFWAGPAGLNYMSVLSMSSRFLEILKRATVSQKSSTPFARRSASGSVASKSQNAPPQSLAQTSLRTNAAAPMTGATLAESVSKTYSQTKSTISNRVAAIQRVGCATLPSRQLWASSASQASFYGPFLC